MPRATRQALNSRSARFFRQLKRIPSKVLLKCRQTVGETPNRAEGMPCEMYRSERRYEIEKDEASSELVIWGEL